MKKDLNSLKEQYKELPIPNELENRLIRGMIEGKRKQKQRVVRRTMALSIAASFFLFSLALNTNHAFAEKLSGVPLLGQVVSLLTFEELYVKNNQLDLDVKLPQIVGLDNKEFEKNINEEIKKQIQPIIQESIVKSEEIMKKNVEEETPQPVTLHSNYEILNVNPLLSFKVIVTQIGASAYEREFFYNVDLENDQLLNLRDLFKKKVDYVAVISDEIKKQMSQQENKDTAIAYFDEFNAFTQIEENQSYYLNENKELVIAFDEYEVAPGSMGTPEFVIPNEVLKEIIKKDKEYLFSK